MTSINLGISESDLIVLVCGRATAEYCSELTVALQNILDTTEINDILFDMEKAEYVDSSFIGLILAFKKKFDISEDRVFLLNPSDKISEIFKLMGLDTFIPSKFQSHFMRPKNTVEINKKLENTLSDIKLLLEAHQNIMETSAENKERFALVEKIFQKELEKKTNLI
ncbi:MAG: STAS domain-containing protein [Brevinemataceae bacterium]